jgi:preprotein translocase subunit SecY
MADMASAAGSGNGIAFLVSAGIMAEIVAKACSSPQTMEINAKSRASTLFKWVNIGMLEGAVFILIAAWVDPKHRAAILSGGALAAAITYAEYAHAKSSGLKSDEPGTEN